jgi:FkbM family methyltransferase
MAEELSRGIEWHGARILVEDHLGQYYSIYSPCPNGDHFGVVQRTHKIFDHHAHAPYCRRENQMFISAAKSRRQLLDIGAAEGFYSALFAAVVGQSAEIVSVDPMDHNWTAAGHLEECRRINVEKNRCARWDIIPAYVSNEQATVDGKANLGGNCVVTTLVQLCEKSNFIPDMIKLDIESWEWEVVTSSIPFLSRHGPTLLLELHTRELKERGLDATDLVGQLSTIGYDIRGTDNTDWSKSNAHLWLERAI